MPTPRETILAALHARLSALPATALRGEVLPERVPTAGLLILRDGEPGEGVDKAEAIEEGIQAKRSRRPLPQRPQTASSGRENGTHRSAWRSDDLPLA